MSAEKPQLLAKWQVRVKQVSAYHTGMLRDNPKWRLEDTAKELDRSIGRVSEDLMLASWMLTDPKVERHEFAREAVDYIKRKRYEQKKNGIF